MYMSSTYGKFGPAPSDPATERVRAVAELARAASEVAKSLSVMAKCLENPSSPTSIPDREILNLLKG
jgi:hypothetical protein